ncbi:argininosuccinate lyase [Haematobia irritans]|uniref:argininosuccinate lyase n=1 Tax=Haematobia irritans TaxID=7368 RepID=UPI003F503B1C
MTQLWGGRFAGKTNDCLASLNCSLPVDSRLFADDLDGSKAYAEALAKAGYLTNNELSSILGGLELVRYDWIEGLIKILPTDEDVHTVNERRLTELIGELGQRLHTGRSRNDQVVTDMKLWMRKAIRETCMALRQTMEAMCLQAQQNLSILMPGYTHLQRAQPVLFSHWLLSHAFALREDCLRLADLRIRSNVLPLGSGALAGNPLGIDRVWLAERLGFASATENSMHAVGDRDFVVDFIYSCSMVGLHLSRLSEDLIIYATKEFDFIEISDEFSTGSSLMPQKRNPDSLELVRGLSANLSSCLMGIMMTIKGTPSTYNKDLQFDKQYCFESFDKLQQTLLVISGVIRNMIVKSQNMEAALSPDMLATDWAYYLVRKGVPFRKAHHYIGAVVAHAERLSVDINGVPLGDLQKICPDFDVDIFKVADYVGNVEKYDVIGGTATKSVRNQLKILDEFLNDLKRHE